MKKVLIFILIFINSKIILASFIDSIHIKSKVFWHFGGMTLENINMNVYLIRFEIENKSSNEILLLPDLVHNQLYEMGECYYGKNYFNHKQYGVTISPFNKIIVFKIVGRETDNDLICNKLLNFKYVCISKKNKLSEDYTFLIQPRLKQFPKFDHHKWKTFIEYDAWIRFLKSQLEGKEIYQLILDYEKNRNERLVTFKIDFNK